MKTVYVLVADYDYEGYGAPEAVWFNHPSEQEIFDYLKPRYTSEIAVAPYKTVEETNAWNYERLWNSIRSGGWIIEESELVG